MQSIYLDHNATTPTRPEVIEAMARCYGEVYANPASQHRPGQSARTALEDARQRIARILDVDLTPPRRDRLILTSGGTEANNLAILGMARGGGRQCGQIVISAGEHQSVIEPAEHLLEQGWRLDTLGLTSHGVVRIEQLRTVLESYREGDNPADSRAEDSSPFTLVSVQLGNHETGVLQPVAQLAAICEAERVLLHNDAIQVVGKLPVSFRALGVAAMSVAAHKFGGPLGIGALIIRNEIPLSPLMFGGHQQFGLRPGTESAALAVGMATALELWHNESDQYARHLRSLRNRFEARLAAELPQIVIHGKGPSHDTFGAGDPRLPQTSSIALPGVDGQVLLMTLDLAGVACSVGSACSSGSTELSPTLRAMELPNALIASSLRFSIGRTTTESEIDEAVARIAQVYRGLA